MTAAQSLIIDTDPGQDDAVAILLELITDADRAAYDQAIIERLNTVEEVPWVTVIKALMDAETLLEGNPNRRHEIDQIVSFLNKIRTEADVSVN